MKGYPGIPGRRGVMRRPYSTPILGSRPRQITTRLFVSGQVVFTGVAAAAGGTIQLGPQGLGSTWHLTSAAFNTTPQNTTDTPEVYLYSGGLAAPNNQLVHSYSGNADSADLDVTLVVGEYLWCVWSGGDPATGNLQLVGAQTVTQWG